ncbi:MAG: deoxyhypusine synthase family protein, partial [Halalkalicoccus sp.]
MSDETPPREEFSHDPIGHASVRAGMTVGELVSEYGNAGIGAADLHDAASITESMFAEDVRVFFGLAGAMVPAGMRQLVVDLIRDGYIDALVTTGANLTHDAIEAIGGKHHHGTDHHETKTPREHDETLRDEWVAPPSDASRPQDDFT